jgi:galactonate dehydratase
MKITDFRLYFMPHRFLFLKIETDEGISGWGEPLVEGRADTLEAAVNEWKNYFIGKDPLLIEDHWQVMYRCAFYRGGPVMMSTIAGINQALWDIKGRYYNTPIYQLLGGPVKNKIKVYRGIHGDTPEELAFDAKLAMEQGYNVVKCCPCPVSAFVDSFSVVDAVLEKIDAAKAVLKNSVELAVDFHGRIHKPMAKAIVSELNKYRLQFIEEPVLPTNKETLREISKYTATPIAIGERLYSRWDFKDLLEQGYIDIIQPDLSHAGGISESLKISNMAEAYDVAVAPHCPLSVISFAACIQMDTATPNVIMQEQSICINDGTSENKFLSFLKDPNAFKYEDGFIIPPKGPGLGIEIDEEKVKKISKHHEFRNPMWRTFDGTPIEK